MCARIGMYIIANVTRITQKHTEKDILLEWYEKVNKNMNRSISTVSVCTDKKNDW